MWRLAPASALRALRPDLGHFMTARVLIIAGSDSGGGAGIQADIKTVTMLGGHAMTAVTAITAQNTLGVQAVHQVPTDMVLAQIDSVVSDIGIDAVKIGMIGSAETASAVADILTSLFSREGGSPDWTPAFAGEQGGAGQPYPARIPVIFDPVMIATSGSVLADAATIAAFTRLMRIATLVTPNLPELAALGGEAAIRALGPAVLIKGGHAEGPQITDRLVTDVGETRWTNPRIETRHAHGTGCTLASGIATGLAQGLPLDAAIERAIAFVRAALANAPGLGAGHGPMGHALGISPFYQLKDRQCSA
jgi:hydroxymethylpyrimidine/phosphomethylpyrimidine kinase